MIEVVGIEGSWPDDSFITWGAAAIRDSRGVYNSITRRYEQPDSSGQFAFHKFTRPISVDAAFASDPLIVVGYRAEHPFANMFHADTQKMPGLAEHKRQNKNQIYIFSNRRTFDEYASVVAADVMAEVISSDDNEASIRLRNLVRSALIIAPRNPYLNAANVFFSGNRKRASHLADAMITEEGRHVYNTLVEALTQDELYYYIKYEHGIAEPRGLGIGDLGRISRAAEAVQKQTRDKVVIPMFPFLETVKDEMPPHRAMEMKAASAEIKLAVSIKGERPLVRIARYIEVSQLQDLLRGNIPNALSGDLNFLQDLSALISPDEETVCTHRPVGQDEYEKVYYVPAPELNDVAISRNTMSILAFVQGISNNVRYAELRISQNDRIQVSVVDNGTANAPVGSGIFTAGDKKFYYTPMVCSITVMQMKKTHRPTIHLREIQPLERDEQPVAITAIPSSVQQGCFMMVPGGAFYVSATDSHLETDNLSVAIGSSFDDSKFWMHRYHQRCSEIELKYAKSSDASWHRLSANRTPLSVAAKIMLALDEFDQRVTIAKLTEDIFQTFGQSMRKNNVRRTVRNQLTELISFDENDDSVMITELGKSWARICRRINPLTE